MKNLPKAFAGVHFIRWIATYPVDKVIRSLNNWGLVTNPASTTKHNFLGKCACVTFGDERLGLCEVNCYFNTTIQLSGEIDNTVGSLYQRRICLQQPLVSAS